jgi:hypothetical protein
LLAAAGGAKIEVRTRKTIQAWRHVRIEAMAHL